VIEIIYYVAASLDGLIAPSDGSTAWLASFEADGKDYGYETFYGSVDALLMGSRTYRQVLGFGEWPYAGKPCWVFSRQADLPPGPGVTVTSGTPERVVAEMEGRHLRRAWLVGGGTLAASFRAAGLITEYIVSVMPVILGGGVPLIASGRPEQLLRLVDSRIYESGVVQVRYRVQGNGQDEGEAPTGSRHV
jgi:dihydrofolate reductase